MTVFRGFFLLALVSGVAFATNSKPVNLQVLPKDMSAASVGKLMDKCARSNGQFMACDAALNKANVRIAQLEMAAQK